MIRFVSAIMLMMLSASLLAQSVTGLPIRFFVPSQGFWISENLVQERNSYAVQVGPDGYVFVAVYTYDTLGVPTFLTLQGQLVPASVDERASGLLSYFQSPTYRTRGGTPFGTSLPANPVTTESEFGNARLRFFTRGGGDFTFAGQTLVIKPFPLYTSATAVEPDQIAKGVWSLGTITHQEGQFGRFGLYTVTVATQSTVSYTASGPSAGPPPGALQYRFNCVACTVLTGGQIDVTRTNQATSRVASFLLSYDAPTKEWRIHGISTFNNTYSFDGYARVEYDRITEANIASDTFLFMSRLPDSYGFGGVQ